MTYINEAPRVGTGAPRVVRSLQVKGVHFRDTKPETQASSGNRQNDALQERRDALLEISPPVARAVRPDQLPQETTLRTDLNPLGLYHRSWGFPTDDELRWLVHHGISDAALWPISGATVRFDARTFDLAGDGERALTFRAEDRGEVIDFVAWQPLTGKLASWRGVAFCLGDVDDVFNPATYFAGGALRVHETPLQWLQADREGIVIVRRDFAYAHLRFCQRIVCDDLAYAERIERWVRPPKSTVEILVADEAKKEFA